MTTSRPVLIGLIDPTGFDPDWALVPTGKGSTGDRILKILNTKVMVSREEYLTRFQRFNLRSRPRMTAGMILQRAQVLTQQLQGRSVVLLGEDVRKAFGHPVLKVDPYDHDGIRWYQIPHPSGLTRWYNNADNRERVATLLAELYRVKLDV